MVNVNKGGNHGLLDKCRPLKEYSWLVAEVRRNQKLYDNLSLAINGALDAMPGDFATRSFLMDHRGEVYNMLYEDFDKQAAWRAGAEDGKEEGIEMGKEEGIEIGKEEGIEIGREQAHVEIATNLIREGLTSAERISSLVGMPLDEVVRLAGELGATLPLQ
jgi:flagellar biosynthesis/type III secretory pathway protein FliH